jgi:RNA polymerase sigma-70 factor (ECF subfamily)
MYHARYTIQTMNSVKDGRGFGEDDHSAEHRTKGDRFECLLNPIWNQLVRYCHAVAGERDAARDLMSETLLVAFQSFEQLRNDDAFKSYLFRIAQRLNHQMRKHAARHTPLTDELAGYLEQHHLKDDGKAAERALETRELYEALKSLPDKQREAVVLFEISGLSLKEVQNVQGGSLSGVKTRIARGREALAKKLGVRNISNSETPVRSATTSSSAEPTTPLRTAERVFAFSLKARL